MAGEQFVVRLAFWPLWVKCAVSMQLVLLVVLLARWVWRACYTAEWRVGSEDLGEAVTVFAAAAAVGLVLAGVGRWYGGAVLSPEGIRPVYPTRNPDRVFPWAEVKQFRRSNRALLGSWFVISPTVGLPFRLAARPADPDGFREAVERFAGPDHPLTRAVWATAGEGQL